MALEIEVLDDPARACSAMLVGVAAGGGHIVLTGGTTPQVAYKEFVDAVLSVGIDVSACTMWFGDERCVPPDDPLSNYGAAKASMFDSLEHHGLPTIHRMKGELGPVEGASDYAGVLESAGSPRFDLVLLGIGSDGHCASLFPDQATLDERSRSVVGVEHAGLEPFVPRVSMTLPRLVNARQVVFLATGESKAAPVAAAFGPDAKPDPHVPSSLLVPMAKDIKVLLDPAAAGGLGPEVGRGSGAAGQGSGGDAGFGRDAGSGGTAGSGADRA